MRWTEVINRETLNELTRPQTRGGAGLLLMKRGYRQLGAGEFGAVFQKDNKIVKLFSADDTAYLTFIKLVLDNPNPHFPLFFSKPIRITQKYFGIRTELLKPCEDDFIIAKDIVHYIKFGDISGYLKNKPELIEACDKIKSLLKQGCYLDIHDGNIMMRGSTVVITDPVYVG